MPPVAACPDLPRYHELAAGKLAEPDEEALLAHLERCDACGRKLRALAEPDALAGLVRQAQASGEDAASGPVARLIERLSKLRPGDTSAVARDQTLPPREPAQALPLPLICAACGKRSKVQRDLAGKKVRCPHCRQVVVVPDAAPEAGRENAEARAPVSPGPTPAGVVTACYHPPAKETYDFLAPPQAPDELGRLGPYRVLQVLGSGGMGVVFRTEDPQLARQVALKAMLPTLAASDTARQRFLREARAAAAIKHDHIVSIYQVGEDHGVPYLAMEFLEGEPLDARLEREGKLPVAEVLRIGREIALALAAAHRRDLIHRDIKPANIWLEAEPPPSSGAAASASASSTAGGRVKILDFGLARAVGGGGQLTQHGAILGTPAYMAPEQAQGKDLDGRCDLFSLGCVLYRLATGEPAFRGNDVVSTLMAVATEEPPPPASLNVELPAELSDLVMRLLAKDPDQRPPSAGAVAESLQEIEKRLCPVAGAAASAPKPQRSGTKRHPVAWRAAMAGGLLATVLTGVVLLWPTPNGLVKIESDDPAVQVVFDKNGPTITGADKEPIRLRAGEHGILVQRGDLTFETDRLQIRKGVTTTLKVELLRGKIQVTADGKLIGIGEAPAVVAAKERPIIVAVAPPKTVPPPSAALEALRRDRIAPEALAFAGDGDPQKAPAALVAVLGEAGPVHSESVRRLAFSPDGKWLASSSWDRTIILHEVATGQAHRLLRGHTAAAADVVFSKDGQTLVSAGADGTLKLWPVASDGPPRTVPTGQAELWCVAVSPDGRFVAAGSRGATIKLWKWGEWDRPYTLGEFAGWAHTLAFSPDGEVLAVACAEEKDQGTIRLYTTADRKLARALPAHEHFAVVVAISRDGKRLASVGGITRSRCGS